VNAVDTNLFYWINHHHSAWLDILLWTASQGWSWVVVLTLAFAFGTLRHEPHRWWLVLIGIALCFLLSDRISVVCFKDVVCRLRPCHVLDNVRMYRTTCGGLYGFVSSHAANVFALALFLSLRHNKAVRLHGTQRTKWRNKCFPLALFAWAAVVAYSRPYLGKHYPGDVVCGALVGLGMGALVFFLTGKAEIWLEKNKRRS